jgi:HSP20 family protein
VNINLGLGDLFKGMGNIMDLLGKMNQEGQNVMNRTGEFQSGDAKGVYGVSVKMGIGGQPTVEQFGNIKTTERGPEVSDVREPLVDVFDETDHIMIVAELPGVAAADVTVEAKDDILTLTANHRDRKYAKEVLLPSAIVPESMKKTFQNGVLEVTFNKAQG